MNEAFAKCQNETLAMLVAMVRHDGGDEAEAVETVLRLAEPSLEDLREAEIAMRTLNYHLVLPVLQKLAKPANPKPLLEPSSRWPSMVEWPAAATDVMIRSP